MSADVRSGGTTLTAAGDALADAAAAPFSLADPLPTGRVVLRASAGTGKTYTIAGLVTRYVAEGVCELPQLLVVTFTRAAAAELRDRVRARLVATRAHLDAIVAGGRPAAEDEAIGVLADALPDEVARRAARLATALADFDAATITTIHGFCQQVLGGLGLGADLAPGEELAEDVSDLLEEVVDDVLVGRFAGSDDPPVSRRTLLELASIVVGNPDAQLVPDPNVVDGEARLRAELIAQVRHRFEARKRHRQVLSYDDLLTRLRAALLDPTRGDAAVATLQRRYRIALIDEFQDTDPIQWDIVARAFGGPDATLVLIGDPKQAIYAFRGADVHAYLDAVTSTADHATLATSWRSDADLLTAFDVVFDGVAFGHPLITHQPVAAAPGHEQPRLLIDDPPLRIRCLRRDHALRGSKGDIPAPVARNHIVADVTAEVARLLDAEAAIVDRDRDGSERQRRSLSCGDVAVLVRTNAEANQVQRSLLDAGVPAIINGVGSVFVTPAASDWRRLLEALEQPTSVGRVRAVALSPFIGWTAPQLAAADDDDLVPLHDQLHGWAELLRAHGVASLLRTITVTTDLPERVLSRPDGERFLTDLQHLGELLHAAATAQQLGPTALAGWLRARMAEARNDAVPPEEQARRLESDDDAVQILTIHRSKGLEFPVVFAPFLSFPGRTWDAVPVFHEDGRRTIDVGGRGWDGFDDDHERSVAERRGEDLRLLYVALTRARHQAVVWWAPVKNAGASALGRVLFGRRDVDGKVDTAGTAPIGNDDRLVERLQELAAPADDRISIEVARVDHGELQWMPPRPGTIELDAARIDRDIDRSWHRTSYSRLTQHASPYGDAVEGGHGARGPLVGSEPDASVVDDEAIGPAASVGAQPEPAPTLLDQNLRDVELPMADVGGGTVFGTFVHAVLEELDFGATDLDAEVTRLVRELAPRHGVDLGPRHWADAADSEDGFDAPDALDSADGVDTPEAADRGAGVDPGDRDGWDRERRLVDGLVLAVGTPLGPITGGASLLQVAEQHAPLDGVGRGRPYRLDELEFELPIAGGDLGRRAGSAFTVGAIRSLLREHLPASDPLAGYADHLDGPGFDAEVRGYLTGSIDLVLRVGADTSTPRYVVVDHKTNRLGVPGTPLTAWDYRPAALADAMIHGHYPLQALLYQVALHRYLRWRQPDYDPAQHLGGAIYLFLRGMVGPAGAVDGGGSCGVFTWTPPSQLIVALSDLLDGRAP